MNIILEKLLPNQKIIVDDEEVQVSESGIYQIDTDDIANKRKVNPIMSYNNKLSDILSTEERTKLYTHMGNSSSIMIYDTAEVIGKDPKTTKDILMWGVGGGVLCRGTNSVWKVVSKEYKEFMLEFVKEVNKQGFKLTTVKELRERATQGLNAKNESTESEEVVEKAVEEIEPIKTPTRQVTLPKKKPGLLLAPVPGKKPQK